MKSGLKLTFHRYVVDQHQRSCSSSGICLVPLKKASNMLTCRIPMVWGSIWNPDTPFTIISAGLPLHVANVGRPHISFQTETRSQKVRTVKSKCSMISQDSCSSPRRILLVEDTQINRVSYMRTKSLFGFRILLVAIQG